MKKLEEKDILRIMKEEWDSKIALLREEVDLVFNANIDGEKKTLPDVGLKIRSKKDQVLYTIIKVGSGGVGLRPPEGSPSGSEDFFVDKESLEDDYELD